MTQQQTIDEQVLGDLVGRALGDFGATLGAALVVIGDRLGLYRGLADLGPLTRRPWRPTPARWSATSGSGSRPRRPRAT